ALALRPLPCILCRCRMHVRFDYLSGPRARIPELAQREQRSIESVPTLHSTNLVDRRVLLRPQYLPNSALVVPGACSQGENPSPVLVLRVRGSRGGQWSRCPL